MNSCCRSFLCSTPLMANAFSDRTSSSGCARSTVSRSLFALFATAAAPSSRPGACSQSRTPFHSCFDAHSTPRQKHGGVAVAAKLSSNSPVPLPFADSYPSLLVDPKSRETLSFRRNVLLQEAQEHLCALHGSAQVTFRSGQLSLAVLRCTFDWMYRTSAQALGCF